MCTGSQVLASFVCSPPLLLLIMMLPKRVNIEEQVKGREVCQKDQVLLDTAPSKSTCFLTYLLNVEMHVVMGSCIS